MQPTLTIEETGRAGRVLYREDEGELAFPWEASGGDVVASVRVGREAEWRERAGWAAQRRAEILRFVALELVRQRAPGCRAELDEGSGWLHLRAMPGREGAPPRGPAPTRDPSGLEFVRRLRALQGRVALVVLAAALVGGGLWWVKSRLFVIDPGAGAPFGRSVRTDAHVATLIRTLEPYTPSLARDPGRDRHRVSLLLTPLDGAAPQLVTLARRLAPSEHALARVLGSDGVTLWTDVAGVRGVDLRTREVVTAAQLAARNPAVAASLFEDARGAELVDGRLRLVARDRSGAVELDPSTRVATPCAPEPPRGSPLAPAESSFLAAGLHAAPDAWLGAHSEAEAAGAFAAGRFVRPVERAEDGRVARRLYLGRLEPDAAAGSRRVESLAPIDDAEFFGAAFLRLDERSEPLRIADPDSALLLFRADASPSATLRVARVALDGALLWQVDTGLERASLAQILPGERSTAFLGARPPEPSRVPEPRLVLLDHASGALVAHSLWR